MRSARRRAARGPRGELARRRLAPGGLGWTSIGGSLESYVSPAQIATAKAGSTYRLNGVVAKGAPADAAALAQSPAGLRFSVQDKTLPARRVEVLYRGDVPDTFRSGREVVVTGHVENGLFVANRGELTT